jgi:ribosomal protein S18 acetylase RimI-like enzyme
LLTAADLEWAAAFLAETLGGRHQARRGELIDVLGGLDDARGGDGPGVRDGAGAVAEIAGRPVGLVTWEIPAAGEPDGAEVRAIAVAESARRLGVGRALLEAAETAIREAGVRRGWLVTTNDNLTALALYQKAGWRLSALRAGAIDRVRATVKPSIPELGQRGIPLRDELELTKELERTEEPQRSPG